MKDFLASLIERTNEFGNHYRKYIQAVTVNLDRLVQRLEERKKRDQVHLLHPAYDFATELKIVSGLGATTEESLRFVGTFFALQFLLVNRLAVDHLRMEIMAAEDGRLEIYKNFMKQAGNTFRMLTANYISTLLDILVLDRPEFVILGVGTKSDQDDIDIGILDDGSPRRVEFNRAIALVSQEMQRYATSFHFHLSEHIGSQFYSASIEEYKKVLQQEIRDFVIINEMLGAAIIIGSERMFERYRREITDRYFYNQGRDNIYHEGYLRGILGEISSLLARPMSTTHINFKEDALRITKSMILALKTVLNIEQVNAWDILEELKERDRRRWNEYAALDRSLTFFEIFRYLYQLLVTQDEEVLLDDISMKNVRRISRILGYADFGKCRAEEHILVHYYEHIQNIRKVIPILVDDIKHHLTQCSVFAPMFKADYQGNLARDYIESFRFFRGTAFWEDILDDFKVEDILKKFVKDLNDLPGQEREKTIRKYIDWVKYDFYLLIEFLTILGKNKNSAAVYHDLNRRLLKTIGRIPEVARNVAYVFYRYPQLINSYLSLNDEAGLKIYLKILESRVYEEEIAFTVKDLRSLIKVHLLSSRFFKHVFLRILDKYPDCVSLLNRPQRLKELARGIYSDVGSMRTFAEKKERLGDYYDLEMMRVGMSSLDNASVAQTNTEFIEFSDSYIQILADICRQEVDASYRKRIITDDILAIFAAGGHAREQAYDDDYDIIVLLNCDDDEVIAYCNKLVSKMNAEIIKRGTIPHHRFAEYFGRFVICLSEIENLLSEDRPDIFIEKSQILGARLIVGSHRFENEFVERVVRTHIFDKKTEYISQMIDEMYSRRAADGDSVNNIKECSGGLRDIEMMMLIVKAEFGIKDPVNSKLFEDVAGTRDELSDELKSLAQGFEFLKHLRDIYRLTAGATDAITEPALEIPARIMGYSNSSKLFEEFRRSTAGVSATIDRLLGKLKLR